MPQQDRGRVSGAGSPLASGGRAYGVTVNVAVADVPLPVAVTVASVALCTFDVAMVNVIEVEPSGTVIGFVGTTELLVEETRTR